MHNVISLKISMWLIKQKMKLQLFKAFFNYRKWDVLNDKRMVMKIFFSCNPEGK